MIKTTFQKKIAIHVPIKIPPLDPNENYYVKKQRRKKIKDYIKNSLLEFGVTLNPPCTITFSRISTHKFDPDNLYSVFKNIKDDVADMIIPGLQPGRADGDPRLTWHYEQIKPSEKGQIGFWLEVSY